MLCCGVVWCGLVWSVVSCGVKWSDVLWCVVLFCAVLCCAVLCCSMVWCAVLCCAVVGSGVEWCGVGWGEVGWWGCVSCVVWWSTAIINPHTFYLFLLKGTNTWSLPSEKRYQKVIPLPETAWQVWTQQDQTYTCFVRHPLASSLDFAVLITLVIYGAGDQKMCVCVETCLWKSC